MTRTQVAQLCLILLIGLSGFPVNSVVQNEPVLLKSPFLSQNQDQSRDSPVARTDQGAIQWNRTYGGPHSDSINSVIETADGGYALAGSTFRGGKDAWLIKTDQNGKEQWNQTYGGSKGDSFHSIRQLGDGGYILTGFTYPFGAGNPDAWLLKTDGTGIVEWQRTYGGSEDEYGDTVLPTTDNGFALLGTTYSYGAGSSDFWVVKTTADGTPQWNQTYGGLKQEFLRSGIQTADGGFALTGRTDSLGTSRVGWVVKIKADGTLQWTQTYDKSVYSLATSIIQTTDGGLSFTGTTDLGSGRRIDVMSGDPGELDVWLMKMTAAGVLQWTQTYHHRSWDAVSAVIQTTDGGFALAGFTVASDDSWQIKTNEKGALQWNQIYNNIVIYAMCQTRDGGLVLVGRTPLGAGGVYPHILKIEPLNRPFLSPFVFSLSVIIVLMVLAALGLRRKSK